MRRRRGWALGWLLAAGFAAGCVPTAKPAATTAAPRPSRGEREDARYQTALHAPAPTYAAPNDVERANALAAYRRARPAAPAELRLTPVAPRENAYPEFDDNLHAAAERPALPPLPSMTPWGAPPATMDSQITSAATTHAAPGAPAAPRNIALAARNPNLHPAPAPSPQDGPVAGAAGPGQGRVYAGLLQQNFYPVEQLVFGGEHPDLDAPEAYRLQPRDLVELYVRDHPEFTGPQEVAADGTLGVPHTADRVAVRGRTVAEAEELMRRAVQPYVQGDAEARLVPRRARGSWYYVFGAVRHPGRFPMGTEPVRLSEALLSANWDAAVLPDGADLDELGPAFPGAAPRGRFAPPADAKLEAVEVYTPHRSRPAKSVHDLRAALLGGVTRDDPPVRPGQVIVVPWRDADRNAALERLGAAVAGDV